VVRSHHPARLAVLGVNVAAALLTWQWIQSSLALLLASFLGLILLVIASHVLKGFSFTGRFLMAMLANTILAGLAWGLWVVASADVTAITLVLLCATFLLSAISLIVRLMQSFEQWEVLCRHHWVRPRVPAPRKPLAQYPLVSLHVPAYAEPPELVIATLDALAQLHYPNFEVLVIDNNTQDPALWKPVEAHCERLGDRFRFFHVDRLAGAKAGALNFALRHTAESADVIGVIDSDYKVEPDFLSALVGYFEDPKMGFVQTPQAYRRWGQRHYLRMCNWEYRLVFATTLVSRNERMAAITVGTMGLIRRKALEEVGGWAEWCVTEDSELSVRIHAAGYHSTYLNKIFGEGLIPESFRDYKKQRFRWTFGPIQELRKHLLLFLPKPFARPSALTPAQKLHHLMHGVGALKSGLEFLILPLSGLSVASMLLHAEAIEIPSYVLAALAASAIAALVLKWHLFRITLSCRFMDVFGAVIATMALDYVIRVASLAGLLTRNTAWRRTNKFRPNPLGLGTLGSAVPEMVLATVILMAGAAVAEYQPHGITLLFSVGFLAQGARFLAAPLMAILAEQGVRRRAAVEVGEVGGIPQRQT
jgi:cellulose synthase/poly-beta-1,6-N-acetylglucosamine synthase-like glycosyltransferase